MLSRTQGTAYESACEIAADEEKHFVSHILAFFAASDGIVVENLGARFMSGARHRRLHAVCEVRAGSGTAAAPPAPLRHCGTPLDRHNCSKWTFIKFPGQRLTRALYHYVAWRRDGPDSVLDLRYSA